MRASGYYEDFECRLASEVLDLYEFDLELLQTPMTCRVRVNFCEETAGHITHWTLREEGLLIAVKVENLDRKTRETDAIINFGDQKEATPSEEITPKGDVEAMVEDYGETDEKERYLILTLKLCSTSDQAELHHYLLKHTHHSDWKEKLMNHIAPAAGALLVMGALGVLYGCPIIEASKKESACQRMQQMESSRNDSSNTDIASQIKECRKRFGIIIDQGNTEKSVQETPFPK